jgi:tetratricopeptide (TPR) repeat protein
MAACLGSLGIIAQTNGDTATARKLWERFLVIQRERQDPMEIARAHERLAWITEQAGDFDAACFHLRARVALRRRIAREQGITLPPGRHRVVDPGPADLGDVRALWEEDLADGRVFTGAGGMRTPLRLLSQIALEQGDYPAAQAYMDEILADIRHTDVRMSLGRELGDLAQVAAGRGEFAEAHRLLDVGLEACEEKGASAVARQLRALRGAIASAEGDWETARPLLNEDVAYYEGREEKERRALALFELGLLALRQNDPTSASEPLAGALSLVRETGGHHALACILAGMARLRLTEARPAEARSLLAESLALRRRAVNRPGIAECLEGLAAADTADGHSERAARLLGAATALREALGAPLPPADRPEQERSLASVRAVLGEDAFGAAWAAGRSLALEQAVAEALAAR